MTLKFEEHFWSQDNTGFSVVNERVKSSLDGVKEAMGFFSSLATMEDEYSKSLNKLVSTFTFKEETGTTKFVFEKLLAFNETVARTHQQFAIKIAEDLVQPLSTFRESSKKTRKACEAEMEKLLKAVRSETSNVEKTLKTYGERVQQLTLHQEKLKRANYDNMTRKDIEKLQDKISKAQRDVEKSEDEYRKSISRLNSTQDAYDARMEDFCKIFQKVEEDRGALLKTSLSKVMMVQSELLSSFNGKMYERMRDLVQSLNVVEDLDQFIRTSQTGTERPRRLQFHALTGHHKNSSGSIPKAEEPAIEQKTHESQQPAPAESAQHYDPPTYGTVKFSIAKDSSNVRASLPVLDTIEQKVVQDTKPRVISTPVAVLQPVVDKNPKTGTIRGQIPRFSFAAGSEEDSTTLATNFSTTKKVPVAEAPASERLERLDSDTILGQLGSSMKDLSTLDPMCKSVHMVNEEAIPFQEKPDLSLETKPQLASSLLSTPTAKVRKPFARRSIKIEGWLDVLDESTAPEWQRRWAALEGGYIWFFDSPEDNNKPQGANKPKSMLSVTRCQLTPDDEEANAFLKSHSESVHGKLDSTIGIISSRKRLMISCSDVEDYGLWLDALQKSRR